MKMKRKKLQVIFKDATAVLTNGGFINRQNPIDNFPCIVELMSAFSLLINNNIIVED